MNTYVINFKGYWLDSNRNNIPAVSGIYMVYRGIYNSVNNKVKLNEILYIGQANNLQERHKNHDKRELFLKECNKSLNETLCYAIAEVSQKDLDIVENALIYIQKPKLNDKNKESFNFFMSRFIFNGNCFLLNDNDVILR